MYNTRYLRATNNLTRYNAVSDGYLVCYIYKYFSLTSYCLGFYCYLSAKTYSVTVCDALRLVFVKIGQFINVYTGGISIPVSYVSDSTWVTIGTETVPVECRPTANRVLQLANVCNAKPYTVLVRVTTDGNVDIRFSTIASGSTSEYLIGSGLYSI